MTKKKCSKKWGESYINTTHLPPPPATPKCKLCQSEFQDHSSTPILKEKAGNYRDKNLQNLPLRITCKKVEDTSNKQKYKFYKS